MCCCVDCYLWFFLLVSKLFWSIFLKSCTLVWSICPFHDCSCIWPFGACLSVPCPWLLVTTLSFVTHFCHPHIYHSQRGWCFPEDGGIMFLHNVLSCLQDCYNASPQYEQCRKLNVERIVLGPKKNLTVKYGDLEHRNITSELFVFCSLYWSS
jgi:hypothetical protein